MVGMDKDRSSKLPPTAIEVEQGKKADALLANAQHQLNEEHDDVKLMNKMVLYSKVVTVRDKQLEENKELEENWKAEQKKLDIMMEIERLKALKAEEERERLRVEAQRRGAAVIIDQIQEREVQRIKDREARTLEQRQMAQAIERQLEAEQRQIEARKVRNQQMLAEVEVVNRVALKKKQEAVEKEKDEDMKIFKYNQDRIAKEGNRLAEERRLKDEKEREIQRLRELQERAADRQGEIDALRAKRAFEEGERQARRQELEKAEKTMKMAADLDMARRRQFLEKEIMLAQQAKAERDEFLRIIDKQKEQEENERKLAEERQNAFKKHASTIR